MGLTSNSVGIKAIDSGLEIKKQTPDDHIIAIAGNPNVGKSTLFNSLTGLNQHTGNWPGKTVANAQGYCSTDNHSYVMVDIPGTYSLMAHSTEEEVARNFICFGAPDAVIVVCDATCLERNLNLVLQTIEISPKVIVCVNLLDEADRKKIHIDLPALSQKLGVPVVGTVACKNNSLQHLLAAVDELMHCPPLSPLQPPYCQPIEEAISLLEPLIKEKTNGKINPRWLSLKLLDYDQSLIDELTACLGQDMLADPTLATALNQAHTLLAKQNITKDNLPEQIVSALLATAETVCRDTVSFANNDYDEQDRRIDKILTNKWSGYPIMLGLLAIVFWLTITGANYPSQLLSHGFFWLEDRLSDLFHYVGAPPWLHGIVILGAYRVLAWVVSVMLPPMAIFFPLFTLLEDAGYLPRVAYNLDKSFKRCHACGKQALTMCMGFGCNAAGVIGCRIIDSPRERLIAMLTNNFVPCNGRFPTLIAIITMFFIGFSGGIWPSVLSAIFLTLVILLGILMTFAVSALLSKTILRGTASSFILELPPYRKPQLRRVIVGSIFDRTLFVLKRAMIVAAPAGVLIWLLANISLGQLTLLDHCTAFVDPFARLLGLDGVILFAFILGLPANEIIVPIIIMAYLSQGSLLELDSLLNLQQLLTQHGWTWITAVSTMLFSLMHWPCSTTLLTIKKETGSCKWAVLAGIIPTFIGMLICFLFTTIARLC